MEENKDAVIEQDNGENEKLADQLDEELKKPLLTEIARKKHFREKFEKEKESRQKLEEEKKGLMEKLASLDKKEEPPKKEEPSTGSDEIEDVLSLRSSGLDDLQVLEARKLAKKMQASLKEAAETPYFKAWVEAEKAKVKVEQATPAPSNRTSVVVNDKTWGEMSAKERQTNLPQALERFMESKK